MEATTLMRISVTTFVAVLTIAVQPSAQSQTYTTFDPAGSQGTSPTSINPAGAITGWYRDVNNVSHGFLRAAEGSITTFDAPGAGTDLFQGTAPAVITPQGLIVGTYTDENYNNQIFLRAKDGSFTTLELPTPGSGVVNVVASTQGAIAGEFFDADGVHGFLRAPGGNITVFDFPAAYQTSFFAPNVIGLNAGGTILGSYYDSNFVAHGFLRTVDGTMTSFDAPNAAPESFLGGTNPASINDSGTVTGIYNDVTQNYAARVFLRASDGTFSSFDPQAGGEGGGAFINPSGAVAGYLDDFVCNSNNFCFSSPVSFLRAANGTISAVSDPEAVQGTEAIGISPAGTIIGLYNDANGLTHGFLRTK